MFVDIGFQQVDLQITVSANLLARAVEGIAGSKVHIAINSACECSQPVTKVSTDYDHQHS